MTHIPSFPDLVPAARGEYPVDLFLANGLVFSPFTCEWEETGVAVKNGVVAGLGEYKGQVEIDLKGGRLVPGLIDSHVHIESSLLTPREYARLVSASGTTTVIADPHEIANVLGLAGIEFMLASRAGLMVDILLALPSCVPATPADVGGAVLRSADLAPYVGRDGVIGLGEMMNVPGVLSGDPGVLSKLALCEVRDGHAPLLSGHDLDAYILSGLQSDHECTGAHEAREKLLRGMYIFAREGSTVRNVRDLAPLFSFRTAPRFSFASDDCHADSLLRRGHIDHCIREAVAAGTELECAIRMATLSAAERFGLFDRGAIAPGMYADFCLLADGPGFSIRKTWFRGRPTGEACSTRTPLPYHRFGASLPRPLQIELTGKGEARVIGLVPGQVLTRDLRFDLDAATIPDPGNDLLKAVVCSRYHPHSIAAGIVQGFGIVEGAIASSVAHDAHNIVAVGADDLSLLTAIGEVIRHHGAVTACSEDGMTTLPLPCAGLMSDLPAEEVVVALDALRNTTDGMGSIPDPFMYLSFLSLTVIPALRLTERGLFDTGLFQNVPLFSGP